MRVAVLGAGLQGACVALELASNGIEVDLYDRNDHCVSQASAQNEGKIHLGYVYANDRTLQTARLMVKGAVSFAPLLRRWIGCDIDRIAVSAPFYYAVHKDSLLGIDEVERHLFASNRIAREQSNGLAIDYFGADYCNVPVRLKRYDELFAHDKIVGAFATPEIAIDAEVLAGFVRNRLISEPAICCVMRSNVLDVASAGSGVDVNFQIDGERFRASYDHVVNTLWDGRLAIDATIGIRPPRPWLFRIKHYLRLKRSSPAAFLPSATIVLGAFGDLVNYMNGELYLSWYPAGMRNLTSELRPPNWPHVLDKETASEIRRSIASALVEIIPSLADCEPMDSCEVKGGVIFAWGATDIDDPGSELHARFEVGTQSYGRYHSIDTGKLTLAPLFAKEMADRIRGV